MRSFLPYQTKIDRGICKLFLLTSYKPPEPYKRIYVRRPLDVAWQATRCALQSRISAPVRVLAAIGSPVMLAGVVV